MALAVAERAVLLQGGRQFTHWLDLGFQVDMTRIIQERLRPISLQGATMSGQECRSFRG